MIDQSTISTIINILSADRNASIAEVEATRRFFASGCVSTGPARIIVEGGLLMTKSAAARFLGISRQQFTAEAEALVNGRLRFTPHFVAQEKFPRFSRIELLEYMQTPGQPTTAHADRPSFQIAC